MSILIHTEHGHFKFWSWDGPYFYRGTGKVLITFEWGRIGTDGQRKDKSFSSEASALNYIHDKCQEKLSKGYVRYPHQMHQLLADARSGAVAPEVKYNMTRNVRVLQDRMSAGERQARANAKMHKARETTESKVIPGRPLRKIDM